jgi:acyl-coenzyme A thioesterase PaaI-like protein
MYLVAPCNAHWDPGVRISEGEAEILIPIQERFLRTPGAVHESVQFTAMSDSAALAVNSISGRTLVVVASFSLQLPGPSAVGELIAKGRFLGMSADRYLAESVLTDPEGNEIARGNGAFVDSSIVLSPEIGYK